MKETCNNGIKKRILIGFLLYFITIGLIFIMIVKNIFIKSFENLERVEVEHNIEMIKSEINHELNKLITMTRLWESTYMINQELDKNSAEIILKDNTFDLYKTDMIILSDEFSGVLYEKQIDFEARNLKEIDKEVTESMIQLGFFDNIEVDFPVAGLMVIDSIPVLTVSHPLFTDVRRKPFKGSLVFGRFLTDDMMSEISNKFNLNVTYELVPKLDFERVRISDEEDIEIRVQNKNSIVGSFYLTELLGEYYIKVNIESPRNAISVANDSIKILRVLIPSIFILTLFVLWNFLDKVILSRIIKLNHQVVKITEEESFVARVDIGKNDEISELSQGINDMLGSLERLQNKVTKANKQLEKKVDERTEELRIANHKLEVEVIERTKLQEEASYLAHHDALTGLPNRLLLTDRLNQGILRAERHDIPLSIMFIDLDGFKIINDTLGHDQGDDLLEQISKRLLASIRKSDSVYRLGGDEFILYIKDYKEEKNLDIIATKIIDIFNEPFILEGQEYFITGSIGIAQYPKDGKDIKRLIKNADTAMYEAKKLGKNRYQKY